MKLELAGKLFVIAAPSGAGKTSLVKALVTGHEELSVAISHTTRPQRTDEMDGVNYHFVSSQKFAEMVAAKEFIEHAGKFSYAYGTSLSSVTSLLAAGKAIILHGFRNGRARSNVTPISPIHHLDRR